MNFELTKEQQMLQEMVRDFAEKEIKPYAREVDETSTMRYETFEKLGEAWFIGYSISRRIWWFWRRHYFVYYCC